MPDDLVYELHLHFSTSEQSEILIGMCSFLEVAALEESADKVIIYSADLPYVHRLREELSSHLSWLTDDTIDIQQKKNENWNRLWESTFQPIVIDDFCIIKSSKHSVTAEADHTIIIDPEMAFGTGHHETTHMMIQRMRKLDFEGQHVLDFGSGTAILSILAEKIGATEVLAIDYDDQATQCAIKCISQNHSTKVSCVTTTISELTQEKQYDIILANINRQVLLSSAEEVSELHKSSGHLLISGVLVTDRDLVLEKYKSAGYELIEILNRGEWLCIHLRKG